MKKRVSITVFLISTLILLMPTAEGQRRSAVARDQTPGSMIRESEIDYQLWEGFVLVQKANNGEPAAQHELGIRYLQGRGFKTDTSLAALWISRAAEKNFDFAHYNLGIFSMNGWGMEWNPFAAYRHFEAAARKNLPDALFVLGLLRTENLIVPRDWNLAYELVRKSADAGFEPAKKALAEFARRGIPERQSDEGDSPADSLQRDRPVFLNFNIDTGAVDERRLLNELVREGNQELRRTLGVAAIEGPQSLRDTATAMELILAAADAGSPEALTLLGWFHEKGIIVHMDLIKAAAYYVRAVRLESPRATELLWNLVQQDGFAALIDGSSRQDNPEAQFVSAGLVAARIDRRLSGNQALDLLQRSARKNYGDSMIELGLCHQSGRWVNQDPTSTIDFWQQAAALGSTEANIRLAILRTIGKGIMSSEDLGFLRKKAGEGSILAEVALAYCAHHGLGMPPHKGEAARMYRNAAQRGSRSAYMALRGMHDEIRPEDEVFRLDDLIGN